MPRSCRLLIRLTRYSKTDRLCAKVCSTLAIVLVIMPPKFSPSFHEKKRTFFLVKQKFNYLKVFHASGCLSVAYNFFACGKSTQKYKQIYYKIKSNLSPTPKRNAKLRRTFKWLEILQFLLNKRMLLSHKKNPSSTRNGTIMLALCSKLSRHNMSNPIRSHDRLSQRIHERERNRAYEYPTLSRPNHLSS